MGVATNVAITIEAPTPEKSDLGSLKQPSFIMHYLDWQNRKRLREGRKKLVGHLIEMRLFALVICRPIAFLDPGAFLITKKIFTSLSGPRYRPTCSLLHRFSGFLHSHLHGEVVVVPYCRGDDLPSIRRKRRISSVVKPGQSI
jgi:hypothetical protein